VESCVAAFRVWFRLRLVSLAALDAVWPMRLILVSRYAQPAVFFSFAEVQELL